MSESERLKQLLKAAKFKNLADFARAAGIEVGTAQKHSSRNSIPKDAANAYVQAAADNGVDVDVDWLLYGKGRSPKLYVQPHSQVPRMTAPRKLDTRTIDTPLPALVPLWQAVATGGTDAGASVHIAKVRDDSVPAPDSLRYIKSAFAVRVWDDSNAPWLNRGATIFVEKAAARANQWCLFGIHDGQDDALLTPLIGVFLGTAGNSWRVQIGATRTTLNMAERPVAWRVVWIEL